MHAIEDDFSVESYPKARYAVGTRFAAARIDGAMDLQVNFGIDDFVEFSLDLRPHAWLSLLRLTVKNSGFASKVSGYASTIDA